MEPVFTKSRRENQIREKVENENQKATPNDITQKKERARANMMTMIKYCEVSGIGGRGVNIGGPGGSGIHDGKMERIDDPAEMKITSYEGEIRRRAHDRRLTACFGGRSLK